MLIERGKNLDNKTFFQSVYMNKGLKNKYLFSSLNQRLQRKVSKKSPLVKTIRICMYFLWIHIRTKALKLCNYAINSFDKIIWYTDIHISCWIQLYVVFTSVWIFSIQCKFNQLYFRIYLKWLQFVYLKGRKER